MTLSSSIRGDVGAILALAVPIAISQVSRVGMAATDTIVAGNISPAALAAVGLASAIWFAVFFFMSGTLLVAAPLVGQCRVNDPPALVARTVGQVGLNGMFWGVAGAAVLAAVAFAIPSLGLDPAVAPVTRDFLFVLALGAPACGLFQALKFSFDALGYPERGMTIGIVGFVVNIPLNILFAFGGFGFDGLGAVGCAWATTIVYWGMLAALLVSNRRRPVVNGLQLFPRPHAGDQSYLFRKGVPSGVTILLDAGFFSVIAWLSVYFGAVSVAANQIATNLVSLLFVGQIALSMAIAIRVSQAKDDASATRTTVAGVGVSCALSLAYTVGLIAFGDRIVGLYTSDPEVGRIAVALLSVALLFQFLDAVQVCIAGALRGMHDTFVPMLVVGVAYWLIALPIACALIFTDVMGGGSTIVDVWYGLAFGIAVATVLLTARFLARAGTPSAPRLGLSN